MDVEPELAPQRAPLRISPTDGLVHRGDAPVELTSVHHDLTATIAGDPVALTNLARIPLIDADLNPDDHYPFEIILELAIDFLERSWEWVEFVIASTDSRRRLCHEVFATPLATPRGDTDLGPTVNQERDGEFVGHAVRVELVINVDKGLQVCIDGGMRRNTSGDIDRARRKATDGVDGSFRVDRR